MLGKIMDPSTINIENISENFFYNFPDYPILKIKQKPFEFYIAPTDNCIHDGSTFDNTELDITITYLGKFVQN